MGIVTNSCTRSEKRVAAVFFLFTFLLLAFGLAEAAAQETVSAETTEEAGAETADAQDEITIPEEETAPSEEEAAGDVATEEGDESASEDGAMSDEEIDAETDAENAVAEQDEPGAEQRDWGRWQPIVDLVDAGGPIIVLLGVLSVLSLAIIGVKLVQFFLVRPGDYRFVERVSDMLAQGKTDKALDFVSRRRGVVARVMETALRGRKLGASDEQLREEVERVARVKLDGLESGLPFLSLIATISPLLGLLGTVLGMIEAFQQLENAGDRVDPAILSGGIWEALLTTAAGLSVAIPAAAFYTWLQRTVDVSGQHMEDAATRVFTADIYAAKAESASSKTEDGGN